MSKIYQVRPSEVESQAYQHRLRLYKDIEFIDEVKALRKEFERRYGLQVTFLFPHTKDFNMSEEDEVKIRLLAEKYKTSNWGIAFYADGHYQKGDPINTSLTNAYIDDAGKVVIVVDEHTTVDHLKEMWPWVQALREQAYAKSQSKVKPIERPDLIYAIHKLRRQQPPMRWSQIFKLYEEGKLEEKSNSSSAFYTKEELANYFRRRQPESKDI